MSNTNKETKTKVIKNASLEEIEKLKQQLAVEAEPVPVQQIHNIQKPQSPQSPTVILKPRTSIFEPQPVPVRLPSGQLAIKNNLTEKNEIFIKRMSAVEEGLLYNLIGVTDTVKINETLDKIIDNCIKSQISVYDLLLIDKFTLLMNIFHLTYNTFTVDIKCPLCNVTHQYAINLATDLQTRYVSDNYEYPKKIHLTTYDQYGFNLDWYVTYFTIAQANDLLSKDNVDVMLLITHSIEGTYITDNGETLQPTKELYRDILYNLNDYDRTQYKNFLNEFSEFGTSFVLENKYCLTPTCEHSLKKKPLELQFEQIFIKIFNLSNNMLNASLLQQQQ